MRLFIYMSSISLPCRVFTFVDSLPASLLPELWIIL